MINLFKKVKKGLVIILTIFSMSAMSYASNANVPLTPAEMGAKSAALEASVEAQLKINNLDDLQKDLSNRLILGIFGKDALIFSLGTNVDQSVADEISMLSMEDVQKYATPFNVGNLNGLLMILSSFFFVAFSVIVIYFAWVMFEALFSTQDSGEFFGNKTSTLFSVLKGSTAMVLIIPAYGFSHKPFSDFENSIDGTKYGSFSISQLFVFKAVGLSNQFSNHIWGSFVNNYQKAYPIIDLPNTYSKENEMKNLLNYVMCVKSYGESTTTNVVLNRKPNTEGAFEITGSYNSCSFNGSIKYDLTLINKLQETTDFADFVSSSIDYEGLFMETINRSLSEAFSNAQIYADLLLNEAGSLTEEEERRGALVTPLNWRSLCSSPSGMFEAGKLNNNGIPVIQYYMEKCLSENFILSFISSSKTDAASKYTTSGLNKSTYSLCGTQTSIDNGERTYVKNSTLSVTNNNQTKTLESCLIESCGPSGGLYECSSAIEFAETNSKNELMIEQGWLTAGAYSYSLFSGFRNMSSKEMINSFGSSFSGAESSIGDGVTVNTGSIVFPIVATNPTGDNLNDDFDNLLRLTEGSDEILDEKKSTVSLLMPSGGLAGKGRPEGIFGIYKFVTCSSNPMSITNGFSCGNITEEMHSLGTNMLETAIELKVAATISQLFGFARTRSKHSDSSGSASTGIDYLGKISKALNFSADLYVPFLRVMGIAAVGSMATTSSSFSKIDSYWYQNPENYLIVVALFSGEVEFISLLLNIIMGLLFILSIVFGFLLPLLPYFLWITVIAGWGTMILESLIVAPVWAATLISPSNNHTTQTAKKGLLILMTIIMRGPFMVVGLVVAWMLSNSLIGPLLEMANISDALLLSTSTGMFGYIDAFVKIIIYMSLVYLIYNLIFSIIEGFYEIASNWLFSSSISPFAVKNRSEKWRSSFGSSKQFLGVK